MKAIVALLAGTLALATASAAQTTQKGTVLGIVLRGPITPVCSVNVPCEGPAPRVGVVASRVDKVVARTVTDAGGHFAFRLAPGYYSVRVLASALVGRVPGVVRIRVDSGRTVRVRFVIDTGIR